MPVMRRHLLECQMLDVKFGDIVRVNNIHAALQDEKMV
jgi:hypothetical protein